MLIINKRNNPNSFNSLNVGDVFIDEDGEFMMKTDSESQSLAVNLVNGRLCRMADTEECTVVKATLTIE